MRHYHFQIQAYEKKRMLDDGSYAMDEVSIVDVIEENEEKAMSKAKGLIKRKYYRLAKMYECHNSNTDFELQERMQMAQLEAQAKAVSLLKSYGEK